MQQRKQSPIAAIDIPPSAKQTSVDRATYDEDGNELSRETMQRDAPYVWAVIVGASKHFVPKDNEAQFLTAISLAEGDKRGVDAARMVKLDAVTAEPKYGSDHSPHMIGALQVSRLRAAGLIPAG